MLVLCANGRARSMDERVHNPALLPFAVVVLAAGGSSRMGRTKQLLPVRGSPLVVNAARAACDSAATGVVVVVGHDAVNVSAALDGLRSSTVLNADWANGMGTSIRAGVETVLAQFPEISGLMLTLADQPVLSSAHLQALAGRFLREDQIVAAEYNGTFGPPVLFGRSFFPQLRALTDGEGAQRILRANTAAVTAVALPELGLDLDTPGEYASYVSGA
jgi:molybdenum cofactor cytidylyltransferase